jgi:hypothetical protein
MDPRRQRAAWAAVIVAAVLLPFAPAVVGYRTLSRGDTDRLYAPVRTLVVAELRAGRLPLWNPYEGTGKPLFAEGLHSVLHPVSLAAAVVAPSSIDFLLLSYLVAAALGAFVLAGILGASGPASAAAGASYALSGYSVSMTGNLVFLAGLSTLPWLVAGARAAGAGARWGAVAAALAAACAFLSGDAQVALVGLALGALLAADAGGPRGAARALGGMLSGVLLAGVQIVATRALLPLTFRDLELPDEQKAQWALAPARLLEWVVPGLFRGPLAGLPVGASGPRLDELVFADSVYLGAPLLVAAALGAARSRRRTALLLASAAGVLLWLALGHHLGARPLLDGVPVWSRFRYSEKLMAPLTLCACGLAALGADEFGPRRLPAAARGALAAIGSLAAAVLVALVLAPAWADALATRLAGDLGPFRRSMLAAGLPHLLAAMGALLVVDRLRPAPARTTALALLVALASGAAVHHGAHLGSPDARLFATPMRLETEGPVPRIAHPVSGLYDHERYPDHVEASARAASIVLTPAFNVASRVDTFEPYTGFEPGRLTRLSMSFERAWAREFRRFGLTHVAIQLPHAEAFRRLAALAADGGVLVQREEALGFEVWAVPHRPWAFFAGRAVAAASPERAHEVVLDLAARGEDETVVLEAAEAPATAPGRVLQVDRGTGSVRIDAESAGPALLVVQDAYWPGWRASIDGEPAEILAADFLVRAVRWPPGRHRLEMTYDPPELRSGLALSAVGAVAVLLLAAAGARGGRAPRVR